MFINELAFDVTIVVKLVTGVLPSAETNVDDNLADSIELTTADACSWLMSLLIVEFIRFKLTAGILLRADDARETSLPASNIFSWKSFSLIPAYKFKKGCFYLLYSK